MQRLCNFVGLDGQDGAGTKETLQLSPHRGAPRISLILTRSEERKITAVCTMFWSSAAFYPVAGSDAVRWRATRCCILQRE